MILYIHGFRTTHDSYIANLLKDSFKDNLTSSDHSHVPQVAIKQLENTIKQKNIKGIIASSLGGYYATYLSNKYNLKTVLINPSVNPHITTKQYLGTIEKQDGTFFEWETDHLEELSKLWIKKLNQDNFLLLLKRSDNILDFSVAQKRYKSAQMIIENEGDHRFSDLENHIDKIKLFLK